MKPTTHSQVKIEQSDPLRALKHGYDTGMYIHLMLMIDDFGLHLDLDLNLPSLPAIIYLIGLNLNWSMLSAYVIRSCCEEVQSKSAVLNIAKVVELSLWK